MLLALPCEHVLMCDVSVGRCRLTVCEQRGQPETLQHVPVKVYMQVVPMSDESRGKMDTVDDKCGAR